MTDKHLDRKVRDADPYRPGLVARLGGAEQQLLEEIMSTPKLDVVESRAPRRGLSRRLASAVAAAAVVTGVIGATALLRDQPENGATPGAWSGPLGLPSSDTGGAGGGYELDLKAAQEHPRLLVGQPGWKITTVYGFAAAEGTIEFVDGNRSVQMNWYKADQYDSYYKDRLEVSKPEPTTVAGTEASVFTYGGGDWAAMLKPVDSSFVELRTSSGWERSEFDALLAAVKRVDAKAFLAALPPEVVTPGKVREEAAKVLADIPIPPGFDVSAVNVDGANSPYHFGAAVTGQVTCSWIAEWSRAEEAGDKEAQGQAAAALQSSHRWKVLQDMNAEGDWPEAIWDTVDQMIKKNKAPEGYKEGLGCQ
ncbi:hypothetical protein FHR83_008512 [Actinoplanes campanulatus]|uniref:Uncharacterized protein n=1 Tax=Actinoplanes campanulatus TaxID=113559 RepID=A0A7W5AQV8_9ACTN|nr:hypothetical protein [Actinoplanes campanulatus]MBB3100786.1 hypothetical protein [Actinoplanes campanulatus]GGN46633.1 hypothetical protein GCM10010109_81980 [Actinoplanes campanulatus]GID41303.1 hypothetical protein Aca09nite_78090 [Actinoplanes campanulatus]